MDESQNENRRGGRGKRPALHSTPLSSAASSETAVATSPPCGACKFLRRKCISGCIFAPHFGTDQGGARFAAVHRVFGASNVSKLLMHIPENRRGDAVVTISYEAQARLSDPVYGCVSTIVALQQQVQTLQAELCLVQNQLINGRFAMANSLQNSQQQHIAMMQPVYSNASSASNNFLNMNSFCSNFGETPGPSNSFEPNIHHIAPPIQDAEEEETHDPAIAFANQIFP